MNKNELNKLKIELLQAIIGCGDKIVLQNIKCLFENSYVKEEQALYTTNVLSKEQEQELESREKLYEAGKLETFSLEEVKKQIEEKYGFKG